MKYCAECGHAITKRIPEDDDRERHCCDQCGSIHYQNPKIIVGCIPIWQNKIMMCKRGIEPRHGFWTLPGGFMELGETTEQGAVRETWEETKAKVEIEKLHGVYNIPRINQVYFIYLARMLSDKFEITPESTEIKLVEAKDIPWDNMAFKVMERALQNYLKSIEVSSDGLFHEDLMI